MSNALKTKIMKIKYTLLDRYVVYQGTSILFLHAAIKDAQIRAITINLYAMNCRMQKLNIIYRVGLYLLY
jgi:hypothetical protein